MKTLILTILFYASFIFAAEHCNENNSFSGISEGSCVQSGYVCNLSVDLNNYQKVLSFYLGLDSNCNSLSTTKFTKTLF